MSKPKNGVTMADIGGLLAALFHLAILVVGVGLIAAALFGGILQAIGRALGL